MRGGPVQSIGCGPERRTQKNPRRLNRGGFFRPAGLFQTQNPFRQQLGFVITDLVRRHRDRAPLAGRTVLDVRGNGLHCVLVIFVLGSDSIQSRANQLRIDTVAGYARLALEQASPPSPASCAVTA